MLSENNQPSRDQRQHNGLPLSQNAAALPPQARGNNVALDRRGITYGNFRDGFIQRREVTLELFRQYYSAFSIAFPVKTERPSEERLLQKLVDPSSPLQIFYFQLGNEIIGGRQFKVIHCEGRPFAAGEFIWVTPEARKLGLGSEIVATTEGYMRSRGVALLIGEIHDPHLCGSDARALDAKAGITPEDRLKFWAKQGYQALDVPYVIPPVHGQRDWITNCLMSVKRLEVSDQPLSLSPDTYLRMLHSYWDSFSSGYREHPEYAQFIRDVSAIPAIYPIPLAQRRSHLKAKDSD